MLSRRTGHDDVVFGAVVAGRDPQLPGVESMGLLINMVPVRVSLDPAQSLLTTVEQVQSAQSRLSGHHHLGLARIQQLTGLGDLFDTSLVFENYPWDEPGERPETGLRITPDLGRGRDATHYPLTLIAAPGRRLYLRLDYRDDLFDRATAAGFVDQLIRVLDLVVTDPSRAIGRVDLLSAEERAAVLAVHAAVVPSRATLPELFEARVAAVPGAVAVVWDGATLSYGELNERANRLAHELLGRGVGPEDVVALALPRSADLVVAVLAVLKAGAAYLPLDPAYPAGRVAYMVADAGPALVLTTTEHRASVETAARTPVLLLDTLDVTDQSADNPVTALAPDHPAYVIYTSGSTGRPKGVVMPRVRW